MIPVPGNLLPGNATQLAANTTQTITGSFQTATVISASQGQVTVSTPSGQTQQLSTPVPLPSGTQLQMQQNAQGQVQARPLVPVHTFQSMPNLPASTLNQLAQGRTLQMLLNSQSQLVLPQSPGKSFSPSLPLPADSELAARLSGSRERPTLQLLKPGQPINLQKPAETGGNVKSVSVSGKQPQLFEHLSNQRNLRNLMTALSQLMGNKGSSSKIPLPTLTQLATVPQLRALLSSVGQLQGNTPLPVPFGPLMKLWQGLQGQQGNTSTKGMSEALARLTNSERGQLQSQLNSFIGELARFQGQSRTDTQSPQVFLSIPYGAEQEQREMQLSLARYYEKDDEKEGAGSEREANWLLTLRFELNDGEILMKSRYKESQLQLNLQASNQPLAERVNTEIQHLKSGLNQLGITTKASHCRVGTVPDSIAQSSLSQTYGIQTG